MSDGSKINLLQMQKYFEGQMDKIRIISDLELSENDYCSLGAKLKSLCFFTGNENDIEEYMLSIVVYSVYSLIYGEIVDDFDDILWMILNKSQYKERMHMEMYKNVFFSYGLDTFSEYDLSKDDLKLQCQKLTARHAGIPNSEKNECFDLIRDYLECDDIFSKYNEIHAEFPSRIRVIVDLFGDDMHRDIITDVRNVIKDVIDGMIRRDDLLKKYPKMSISLIDHCILWNDMNRHRIRFGSKIL